MSTYEELAAAEEAAEQERAEREAEEFAQKEREEGPPYWKIAEYEFRRATRISK